MGRMPVPHRPKPFNGWGCPLPSAWGITRRFHRLSPSAGLVAYALRTRAPLSETPKGPFPFDLHVLGLPLAFILSQDQTLHCIIVVLFLFPVLGLRYDFTISLPCFSLSLCWPQAFKEPLFAAPVSQGVKTAAKVQPFFFPASFFLLFFQKNFFCLIIK